MKFLKYVLSRSAWVYVGGLVATFPKLFMYACMGNAGFTEFMREWVSWPLWYGMFLPLPYHL